jgi:hypothetical protein
MSTRDHYPDITDILAQKARGRRERASLSFTEKLMVLEKLRKNVAPIVQARRARARVVGERAKRELRFVP